MTLCNTIEIIYRVENEINFLFRVNLIIVNVSVASKFVQISEQNYRLKFFVVPLLICFLRSFRTQFKDVRTSVVIVFNWKKLSDFDTAYREFEP